MQVDKGMVAADVGMDVEVGEEVTKVGDGLHNSTKEGTMQMRKFKKLKRVDVGFKSEAMKVGVKKKRGEEGEVEVEVGANAKKARGDGEVVGEVVSNIFVAGLPGPPCGTQ